MKKLQLQKPTWMRLDQSAIRKVLKAFGGNSRVVDPGLQTAAATISTEQRPKATTKALTRMIKNKRQKMSD